MIEPSPTPETLEPVTGPSAWHGSDFQDSDGWIHEFSDDEIREIASAVERVVESGLDLSAVRKEHFPLPILGPRLEEIQEEVVWGRGFVLFRGLPVRRWSRKESAVAYWGLGRHFGDPVSQNAEGHLLGHVKDIGHDPSKAETRLYATHARHPFHTDSCDVVGLLCLQPAKEGGLSMICSSATVYNEMLERRPELARVLAEPFFVDRKGEVPEGKEPYYRMPVFNFHGGHLTTYYARDFLQGASRHDGVPELSDRQVEAMEMLEAVAGEDGIRLDMTLRAGDIQLLHNHQIFHSRTGYRDHADPERRRHLLRLWLSAPNGRPLPPVFAERYGTVEVGEVRGGIVVPGTDLHAPLEPA